MRRIPAVAIALAAIAFAASHAASPAHAQHKVKVGVLKLTSSAPVFVGVATALAAGQVEVGATGNWWVAPGFMKSALPLDQIVDTSFIEAAVRELGG